MEKKKSGLLSRIFRHAAIGSLVAVATTTALVEGMAYSDDLARPGGSALTQGEAALAHSVFGNQINTDHVRKHFGPSRYPVAASVNGGSTRHIDFWGPDNQSRDFSKERGWKQGVFMHEMTHIWQNQNSLTLVERVLRGCELYEYKLTPNAHFGDFCVEQQAEIVMDYVNRVLYPRFGRPGIHSEFDRQLARVVEEQFPQARITRHQREIQMPVVVANMKEPGLKAG